jgi:putative transposase
MRNHWHLVLWPKIAADMSRFIGWLCTTHVRRWRAHRGNAGEGHLYQGRFKSFLIQRDEHLLTVLRYVEGNPLRARIVKRAEDWPWSSLSRTAGVNGVHVGLTPWPVDRPHDWAQCVNERLDQSTLKQIQTSLSRNRPYGSEKWISITAKRMGLERTLRDPWRPTKKVKSKKSEANSGKI